ncbi:hypothetical protein ABFV80_000140 [Vandammella animalimorsus]|uniref:hypothetical protein n=1 Tax=Vandammella animalimorsus TaxID=2029117 RepID=UPI00325ACAAC
MTIPRNFRFHHGTAGAKALALLLAAFVFFVNIGAKGPMIQADEGSYLANAAAIAGYKNDMASSYHAGYSLLLSPAFLTGLEPETIWIIVKLINAILFGFGVYFLWVLSELWEKDLDPFLRTMIVATISAYPMWVVMTGYAFSQIALFPLSTLIVILIYKAANGKALAWLSAGLASGFFYWIHPTGVVAVIATGLALLYFSACGRRYYLFFLSFAIALAMVIFYKYIFTDWLNARMMQSGLPYSFYPSIRNLLSSLTDPIIAKKLLSVLGGHVFYVSAGSLGLIAAGIIALSQKMLRRNELLSPTAISVSGLYVCLSFFGVLALSSMFMATGAIRLDHWMYGRYVEGFIAPALLAGLLFFSRRKILLGGIGAVTLGAVLLGWSLESYMHTAPFNVSSFWQEFYIRDFGLWAWLAAAIVLTLCFAFTPQRIRHLAAISFFSFCSFLQINYHSKEYQIAKLRTEVANHIRKKFPKGTCIGFDLSKTNGYHRHIFWFDLSFKLFDYDFKRVTLSDWVQCDGPLLSYSKDISNKVEAYIEKISPQDGPLLWVKGRRDMSNIYPVIVKERNPLLIEILGDGWHGIERTHVWSRDKAVLRIPHTNTCTNKDCTAIIRFNVFSPSKSRPVFVDIYSSSKEMIRSSTYSTTGPFDLELPLSKLRSHTEFLIHVRNATSPKELLGAHDSRVLGIALASIDVR